MNFQFQKKKFEKNSRVELQSIFRGAKIDEYPLNNVIYRNIIVSSVLWYVIIYY